MRRVWDLRRAGAGRSGRNARNVCTLDRDDVAHGAVWTGSGDKVKERWARPYAIRSYSSREIVPARNTTGAPHTSRDGAAHRIARHADVTIAHCIATISTQAEFPALTLIGAHHQTNVRLASFAI